MGPISVAQSIFEPIDLASFSPLKRSSKMMDSYQLEQKSSRDMWQLSLSILENGPNICRLKYF